MYKRQIILRIPEVAYDQASAVILLGCVLGMGHLATTGQLLIFRVSGLSVLRTSWITVKNALVLIFLLIFIGEVFAPVLTDFAESERFMKLSRNRIWRSYIDFASHGAPPLFC